MLIWGPRVPGTMNCHCVRALGSGVGRPTSFSTFVSIRETKCVASQARARLGQPVRSVETQLRDTQAFCRRCAGSSLMTGQKPRLSLSCCGRPASYRTFL